MATISPDIIRNPYIGTNGNWYVWNSTTYNFVDTGVAATGDTGATAYEQAVAGGYAGTEEQFNADLAALGTAVIAAELAETNAEGFATAAAASAAQLAAGAGSPVGQPYDDLAALNTADPAHTYNYLILSNGHWCYYDTGTSAFVDSGYAWQAATADAPLADAGDYYTVKTPEGALQQVGAKLVDITPTLGKVSIMTPISGILPNIDTTAKTLTLYTDTMITTSSHCYRMTSDVAIDLTAGGTVTSTAKKLYYRPGTNAFFVLAWNTTTALITDLFVGTIRLVSNTFVYFSETPYTVNGFNFYDRPVKNIVNANVRGIAHRGYRDAPENTLPAFVLAKRRGFVYVECDVQFSSDGTPYLLHDETVDRTSDGTGNIADLTDAQLATYDFGTWFSAAYAGTAIPTFSEFLILCKKLDLYPYVELKIAMSQVQVDLLVDIANKLGMLEKITWVGADYTTLGYVVSSVPAARIGFATSTLSTEIIDGVEAALTPSTNDVFLLVLSDVLTQVLHDYAVDAEFGVEVWSVTDGQVITFAEMGVTGIYVELSNVAQLLQADVY
jgi:hypothetical protein